MEINVPTSWDDITVNQYQAFSQIDREDYKSDLEYMISVLQVFCELDSMIDLPISAINEITPHIAFLQSPPPQEQYNSVIIDDVVYEWINSFTDITVGEAISVELPIDLEGLTVTMAYDVVLAVMLREQGKKFDSKQFQENRDKFGKLPITEVIGKLLFFLNGGQTYTNHIKTYSIVPMRTTISQRKKLPKWKRMMISLKLING